MVIQMKSRSTGKRNGTGMIVGGLLLLAAALFLTGYNLWDEQRAGNEAASVLEQVLQVQEDTVAFSTTEAFSYNYPTSKMQMPSTSIDGNRYIGVLEFPKLGLTLPIISEWSEAKLRIAPCRYHGSVYAGDLVIAGHNYRSHFGRLQNLSVGDQVRFIDMDGNNFEYDVVEIEELDGTAIEEMVTGDWDLTLFTCTYSGQTRFTVRCAQKEPVSKEE